MCRRACASLHNYPYIERRAVMLPAVALKHIFTLILGAANIANERQQRLLLQSIAEIARKGLADTHNAPGMQH